MTGWMPGGSAGTSFCSGTEISINRLAIGIALERFAQSYREPGRFTIWTSEIALAGLRREAAGVAFPDDPRMLQHIDPVGMRQREGDILLAQQHRDRRGLAQFFQRLRQLFENDRCQAQRGLVEDQ